MSGGHDFQGLCDALWGWQEIADYLRLSVDTAKSLERDECMPIYRMRGRTPMALKARLDAWLSSKFDDTTHNHAIHP